MESLNFSTLALQFFKYQANLQTNGFQFKLEEGANIYEDSIVISFSEFLKTYYFVIRSDLWDQYRQFNLWHSQTGKYHFRVNPINWEPLRINSPEPMSFTVMTPSELPDDLKRYGQAILQMIHEVADRLRRDKLAYDSTRMII